MALVEHFRTTAETACTAMLNDVIKGDVSIMTELIGGLGVIAHSARMGLIALTETQMSMLTKIERKIAQVGVVYAAAMRTHSLLEGEITARLSRLSAVLHQRICMWEDILRNHGTASDGGRADCTLSLCGWAAHMSRWLEDTKMALISHILEHHSQLTILEKQIKSLNGHYVAEAGSERDQPQRILFALENSLLSADEETVVFPAIRQVPLYFKAREYETWAEEERAAAIEGAQILDASVKAVNWIERPMEFAIQYPLSYDMLRSV